MDLENGSMFFTDGKQWEIFSHSCLKLRHKNDNYKPVEALSYAPIDQSDKGDYGLDGFTMTGIAYQCYLPEKEYSEKELYKHIYNKIRDDVKKLYTYKDKLELLLNGVKIKTWNFVTPKIIYSTDFHRLCNQYENNIKEKKLPFIDDDFRIGFVDNDSFRPEFNILFNSNSGALNFLPSIPESEIIADYKVKTENNYLVNNALRKNTKLFPENEKDYGKEIISKTDSTIEDYLIGQSIEKQWFDVLDSEYERYLNLKKALERRIKSESKVPFSDKNKKIQEIRALLIDKLGIEFPSLLNEAGKEDLASSIIAEWLLNCSLDFI